MYEYLKKYDKEVFSIVSGEDVRQAEDINLIPSENYVSKAVQEALYSTLTNKYAEGYSGRRYYGGQQYTDKIEDLAIDRVKKLFGCEYANVQPLSGAVANIALYFALLEPGSTILAMDLSHGGHLTHGHPVTWIAKLFKFVRYTMSDVDTGEIDYDELREIALREKPSLIMAGFSSYTRELDYQRFVDIAKEVGAYTVADVAHIAGLIAGGVHTNPFDFGFDVMTSTTHKTLRGPRGGLILVKDSKEIKKKVNSSVFPGLQGGPHMHQIAGKAVSFQEAMLPSFKTYASQIITNAKKMASVCQKRGVRLIGGGTDNHMLVADSVASFGLSGRDSEEILEGVGITLNRNVIPDDGRKALDPSGIRFGTPAITTRGFTEDDVEQVATRMCDALSDPKNEELHKNIREEMRSLAEKHPIPDFF